MSEVIHLQPVFQPITPLGAACIPDVHGRCVTCSDEGRSVTVIGSLSDGTALVALDGQEIEIDVSLIDDVAVGQVLLVHGGVALERLEAES